MDYRRFLEKPEELVLPWLGGPSVDAPSRRLRLAAPPPAPGWYRMGVKGRAATVLGPAEAPDLSGLPSVRGPLVWRTPSAGEREPCVVTDGARAEPLHLVPSDEPALFASVQARRWHGGALLFEGLELDAEVEEAARRALEEGRSLSEVKGASSALRAAFATATVDAASRRLGIPASATEVRQQLRALVDGGQAGAEAFLRALAQERALVAHELDLLARVRRGQQTAEAVAEERARRQADAHVDRAQFGARIEARAEAVLDAAGARLVRYRLLGEGRVEVTFTFLLERFTTVIDGATLQVLDAGLCLGHPPADEALTLESLPAVIREAIDTEQLVITRHG